MRDETESLKHHPDPPPERWKARTRHGDDVLPEQRNEPPAWPLRQIKQAKQRRLARPRRTAQKMKRAFLQREVQIAQRLRARAIAQADILESNNADHCCNRSEEHTSELQSLMRISYAVFCLKKKIPQK